MAEKNNATCSICGKEYYMCLSCKDSMKVTPWKMYTDTAEHYKVFQVIRGYSTGVYNKEEARAKFNNVDIKDLNTFRPHIKKIVKDILKEEKPVVKVVEEVVEPVVLVQPVEQEAVTIEENAVVEKQTVSRKRNYRAEVE